MKGLVKKKTSAEKKNTPKLHAKFTVTKNTYIVTPFFTGPLTCGYKLMYRSILGFHVT